MADHSTRRGAGTITIVCHWCGESPEPFTDTDHGRAMLNTWPDQHQCRDHRNAWRAA